ncbi:hypothetical protein [Paraburkholderia sp. 40]|uniref:hypothetical protein n=1 Tax=Paraburkholderia sp. 40 TaxID=2991059 RepID=UPI003D197596
MFVQITLFQSTGATRNDDLHLERMRMWYQRVRIVCFVDLEDGRHHVSRQCHGFGLVASLTAREAEFCKHAQAINQRVNLRAEPVARATQCMISPFLGVPAASVKTIRVDRRDIC